MVNWLWNGCVPIVRQTTKCLKTAESAYMFLLQLKYILV
jgi:hypothetical protein